MQDVNEGRIAQKARTRTLLLRSAADLIQQGRRPTIEEAAEAVGISKRTAYRYFVSQDHMLADAALESIRPEFQKLLEGPRALAAPSQRLECLIRAMNGLVPVYENELRVIVRAALDRSSDEAAASGRPRGQRRVDWVAEAIAPLKFELPPDLYERLTAALAATVGFDVYILLRDIAQLAPDTIDDTMVWMGLTLLQATEKEAAERL